MLVSIIMLVLIVVGVVFMLTAAIGIVRMPDVFLRMSAVSKAATLGAACILLASAFAFGDYGVSARALAAVFFLLLTAPVASHLIGRASYIVGVPLWRGTVRDDLRDCYDPQTHHLSSSRYEPGEAHQPQDVPPAYTLNPEP